MRAQARRRLFWCLLVLCAFYHFHVFGADDQQKSGLASPEQRWADRLADRKSFANLSRAYAECVSDADLKAAFNDIKRRLKDIDLNAKLLAVERLLRSPDREGLDAAKDLIRDINNNQKKANLLTNSVPFLR